MDQAVICIFAKPPLPGKAKTRLIPELGEERAAELAEAFLQDTVDMVRNCSWASCRIAATENFERSFFRPEELWLQGEGDLGIRLEGIFRRGLQQFEMVFALGADSPGLLPGVLARARDELQRADAVLGSARDGGFYLLGMKKCPEGILDKIQWSHAQTYTETVGRLREKGWTIAVIDHWFDIDTPEDLRRVLPKMTTDLSSAPKTLGLLRKWYPQESLT
ncbi:MAG TPA: TIGR04282 family arsenosugar biosynthesis glycosyltransferase [Candidatus Angelobacter sp.]|jgi:rSAM/selenodomain-associated transferase 1|nr:TIGR04282 family arsenosugar biosynthesis glycosyltransferase [Candidatus Angelobacter sp.]